MCVRSCAHVYVCLCVLMYGHKIKHTHTHTHTHKNGDYGSSNQFDEFIERERENLQGQY